MAYFIPAKHTDRDIFKDEGNSSRHLRVVVEPNGSAYTFTPLQISCTADSDYQKWHMKLKNRDSITVGHLANEPCVVQVSADNSYWYTVFTGYISDAGFYRHRGFVHDDYVSVDLVDATQRKGTKRKLTPALLSGFKISDPDNESASILHYLADEMGVELEAFPINLTKDIVSVGELTVWEELQKLKSTFGADMYFNHLGQLRFVTQFDSDKNLTLFDSSDVEQFVTVIDGDGNPQNLTLPSQTQDPEWTFQGDPDQAVPDSGSWIKGPVEETSLPVRCNRAKCEFTDYQQLSARTIYKNTENYNQSLDEISIEIAAGEYWPGPNAADIARLQYKDPDSGEEYPYAITVNTPSVGASGDVDILYSGGTLSLVSFNGSNSDTKQNPGSSEIILQNTGGSTCTIKRLRVTGTPYRNKAKEIVEYADSSITDEVNYVDTSIDGKYAVSADQVYTTLYDTVENQKDRVRRFSFSTAFLPWIQRGAIVQVQMPGEAAVRCRVDTYQHQNRSRTLQGMVTSIVCTGKEVCTPVGSPKVVEEDKASPVTEKLRTISSGAGAIYRSESTSAPVTPQEGDFWYQTDTKLYKRYSGSEWEDCGASPLERSSTAGVDYENSTGNVQILSNGKLKAVDGEFSGSLSAATGTFSGSLSAATGTFSGSLSAATGTFSGTVAAQANVHVAPGAEWIIGPVTAGGVSTLAERQGYAGVTHSFNSIMDGSVRVTMDIFIVGSGGGFNDNVVIKVDGSTVYSQSVNIGGKWASWDATKNITVAPGEDIEVIYGGDASTAKCTSSLKISETLGTIAESAKSTI